jgi:uncharacterized repeat protein (TIGR02543 family)
MFRSVLVGTVVASLLGIALVNAQVNPSDDAGPAAPTAEASAPEPAPQEPAYWAENRPPAGTSRSLPKRLFPADNWWNQRVADAPLDPKSAAFIESIKLGGDPKLRYDWGNNYGLPFVTVSGNYPKVRFQSCAYWGETDKVEYPIPIPALTEPGWTEDLTGTIDNPVSTGDRHLIIVDVENQFLYEIYQPYRNATGSPKTMYDGTVLQPGSFFCASAAMWDMKTNNTRPDGWTSSDAAGLQVLPGLVQYDEVMGPDPITHAHRITLNWSSSQAPKYVWPATHFAGSYSATNPPLGTRLRLKASKDLSFAGPHARKVLQAMKDYGVIFADNGGHGMITGTNDARWGNYESPIRVEFATAFGQVSLADFEVVELGWRPTGDPSAPTIKWPAPEPIVQGKPLGPDELSATADVPGTFLYNPPAGSVLPPGVHTLTTTFIPAASAPAPNATAADATTLEGEEPPMVHGPMVAHVDEVETNAGLAVPAGTTAEEAVASVTLTVLAQPRTTPAVDWASPAPVVQGTALSAAQLNASSPVPGTFVYAPAAGTVLGAGTHTLSAVFTPADTMLYNGATAYMALTVKPYLYQLTVARPTGGTVNGAGISCGTAGTTCQVTMSASMSIGLQAIPDSGYSFSGWAGDCAGTNPNYTLVLGGLRSCSAAFTANPATPPPSTPPPPPPPGDGGLPLGAPYSLTVARPSGGTVRAAGINCGTKGRSCDVTMPGPMTLGVQATADSGYRFLEWTGNCSGSGSSYPLALEGPRSCGASFIPAGSTLFEPPPSPDPYTLTITRPSGGTVQAAGINCGTKGKICSVTMPAALWLGLQATADRGYTFTGWMGDCSGTQPTFTIALAGPRTCSATFVASR